MDDPFVEPLAALNELLDHCTLCPRQCRVNRRAGEKGFCRLGHRLLLDSAMAHHGEEPPLSGTGGAGTIFLSSCNLKCSYCQNHQISHSAKGRFLTAEEMAEVMLALQQRGCHNVEPVTPTPQLPGMVEALGIARSRGLTVPFVYNCGGYESPGIVRLLDGLVDIYLPDFKYGLDEEGRALSEADDYPRYAVEAIGEMVRQVGDGLESERGVAKKGVLIRHLILPGKIGNSKAVLDLIKRHISVSVPLSLMSQYTPMPKVRRHPDLGRRLTRAEYHRVVDYALELGFENIFAQEVDERSFAPDFERDAPFQWDKP
jgi:putative pyruvate formate lyase activating enzyme